MGNKDNIGKIILGTIMILIIILGIPIGLCMWKPVIGVIYIAVLLVFGTVIIILNESKQPKSKLADIEKKYGKEPEYKFDGFYFGCFSFDDRKNKINPDIIREGISIISNNEIILEDNVFQKYNNKPELADYLLEEICESNIGVAIDLKTQLKDILYNVNNVIKRKKLPIKLITEHQVKSLDNIQIARRRMDNYSTAINDINVIHDIIEKYGYELINVISDEYCLTIVDNEQYKKLQELESKTK